MRTRFLQISRGSSIEASSEWGFAYSLGLSLPCSTSRTDSEGAINYLALRSATLYLTRRRGFLKHFHNRAVFHSIDPLLI